MHRKTLIQSCYPTDSLIGKNTVRSWLCLTVYNLLCSLRLEKFNADCILLRKYSIDHTNNYERCLAEKYLSISTSPFSLYINKHLALQNCHKEIRECFPLV